MLKIVDQKMNRVNLLCETYNCGKPAISFGMKGSVKTKCCEAHTASLFTKNMQVFDIAGYGFIETLHDSLTFETRKLQVEKGRGNLTVLEAICESELSAALKAIEAARNNALKSVHSRFEEMQVAATTTCSDVKAQLAEVGSDFEQFLSSKERQLSPTARLLSSDLPLTPRLVRFGIVEVSDNISAVLSASWTVAAADIHSTLQCLDPAQANSAIGNAMAEAMDLAQRGIPRALQYADLLIGKEKSFDQAKDEVMAELLKWEKWRGARNWTWLQRSWDLRQRFVLSNETTAEVGQLLATHLYRHLGRFSEAEQVLRHCYDITSTHSPLLEVPMSLCNSLCEMYFASAQYQQAEQLGVWVLQAYSPAHIPAEHFWATLLYLTSSQRLQSKNREANAVLEDWGKRDYRQENLLAEMLKLLTYGTDAYWNGKGKEAKELVRKAARIGTHNFPTSPFTALAFFRLSFLAKGSKREDSHRQAESIYDVAAPKCIQAAMNLNNLGNFLEDEDSYDDAKDCYKKAQSIYEIAAPKSKYAANNLYNLGILYKAMEMRKEARGCYTQAQSIYEDVAPMSGDAANNLCNLGVLLAEIGQQDEAEKSYRQARTMYEVAAPKSVQAANNLSNLGVLLKETGRENEAEVCHRQAQSIYEVAGPMSVEAAKNLYNLGILYKKKRQWSKAKESYERAEVILDATAPKSVQAAHNYYNLGALFEAMGETERAIASFGKAALVYEENDEEDLKSMAEDVIDRLKKSER